MTTTKHVTIGSRGSQLALYQAHTVARLIADAGGPACDIVTIKTSGDRLQERPLSEVGGKRLFVKEIEDALLANTVDVAVHSSKDMPAELPPGLSIAAVLERADKLRVNAKDTHVALDHVILSLLEKRMCARRCVRSRQALPWTPSRRLSRR